MVSKVTRELVVMFIYHLLSTCYVLGNVLFFSVLFCFTSLVSILHYFVLSIRKQAHDVQCLSQGHVMNKLESSGLNPTLPDPGFLHIHLTSCCLYLKIDDFKWFPKSCDFFF